MFLSLLGEDSVKDIRNRAMILILLDCGLRVSKLINLKMDDVDIDKGIVIITGKGSKQRPAPIGLKTKKAILKYILLRKDSIPWLWISDRGNRLTSSGVQQTVRKLGKKLGIRLYPHLLRHTFAINFLRNGANTFECQYTLGHSSLEMTKRYCEALNFEDVYKKHQVASPVDNVL